jgi:hypothetical protein
VNVKPGVNLLKPAGYVMHQQGKHSTIVRSAHTVLMCFVLSKNKQRFYHLHHKLIGFYNPDKKCLQRSTDWGFK